MKKGIVLGICLLLSSISIIKAQSSLGIDSVNYIYSDTVCFNDYDGFTVNVVNYGPQPYSGMISLEYGVDSSNTGNSLVSLRTDTFQSNNLSVFGYIGDSANILISTGFRSGINTVVIWPRSTSSSFTTYDSLKIPVWVMCFAGINNPEIKISAKVFPNPAKQELFIANNDKIFIIEQVRVLSTDGKLLSDERFTGKVDLSTLAPGIYFIEFQSTSGKTSRYKVIKE